MHQILTYLRSLANRFRGAHQPVLQDENTMVQAQPVPYDENLLERSRTQWQFGAWDALVGLDRDTLQHHPDRAKLALLAAAGHAQQGNMGQAHVFTRLAKDWGCGKQLISQVLIAGVHNSLGKAATVAGDKSERVLGHFEKAIAVGMPGADRRLVAEARVRSETERLGIGFELPVLPTPPKASFMPRLPDNFAQKLKEEITAEVKAEHQANNPNPYAHNRTLTPKHNKELREFAEKKLCLKGIKPAYIDYLATKSNQIERTCVGRLATTVQDAITRQLVAECVAGDQICILEIGALYGISLAILYNHAVTRYPKVTVVCLDPFDGYYGKALDAVLNQPVNDLTFVRNMSLANVPPEDFAVIKRYSTDPLALKAAGEWPINLLIIDGDHSYEGVKFDFDAYFPLLQPGGYVVFDDYNAKEWPGVQRFIDQDLRGYTNIEYLGDYSRTAVGRKVQVAER